MAWPACTQAAPPPAPTVSIQPATLKPGDPILVTIRGAQAVYWGTVGEARLNFYPVKDGFQAIAPISVNQPVGALTAAAFVQPRGKVDPEQVAVALSIVEPKYPSRELSVDSKYVEPPREVKHRIEQDREAFARAFRQPFGAVHFREDFLWPRNKAAITAPFGDLRLYNGKKQSQHFGTDLDGDVGDPIYAANEGVVVLARDCYTSGNSVVVFHGASLFTVYLHMSKMDVKEGDEVKQGELLGRVGKTGRVTGPHLHWGVKINGQYVDGQTLLKLRFFSNPQEADKKSAGRAQSSKLRNRKR
jgi:murein DD-endopeptidase MepM/ murein hydrolase activator NlpD